VLLESHQITVQKILQQGDEAYAHDHALPGYVRRAVQALLACRTALLGGHVQACPAGHIDRIWYNSCHHRMCPQCAWLQIERWRATQKARLLACDPYHVMFTLPNEMNDLWLANVAVMTTLLLAWVRDTVLEVLGDPTYLGATPGLLATLHTWTQTLRRHPHLHALVTGGGLTHTGRWVPVRNGCLLPSRVVMALFRGQLLAAIRRAVRQEQVQLPAGRRPQRGENLLHKLGRAKWNVHICERYPHGTGVLIYLARYVRGGPLSNQRLVSSAHGEVTFRYRVNGEASDRRSRGLMTWPIAAFIGRYLRHVPAPSTRVVRSYGLYAPTKRETLAICRGHVGQGSVEAPVVLDWQAACSQQGAEHPERCPVCGQRLVCRDPIPRLRIPPPAEVAA
jgi:hypothetical protein